MSSSPEKHTGKLIMTAGEPIAKSPLNNSKSKYLFSFGKAQRFSDPKKQTDHPFYNISVWRGDRSTTLGKGTKYDFTKENKDKCQNFYNVSKDFDPKTSEAPRYSFGLGRSHFEKCYYETNKMIDKSIPGPGIYNFVKPFGYGSAKYSLSFRQEDKGIKAKSKEPGPGEYKIIGINPKGVYPNSNFGNTPSITFGNNRDKRFKYDIDPKQPGPGAYDVKWLIDGKGYNFISKFRSTGASTIVGRKPDPSTKFTCVKCNFFLLKYFFKIISTWTWFL